MRGACRREMHLDARHRDVHIELYRVLLMFGICWLHCCQQGGRFDETREVYYLMRPCVVGFVFISGWFGIKLNWRKLVRMLGLGLTCSIISVLLRYVTGGWCGIVPAFKDVLCAFVKGYWFLWAYICLMALSPILNAAIDGNERTVNVRVIPLMVIIFGWAFLTHVPVVKNFIPTTAGVTASSCLMMSAVYIVARLVRCYKYDRFFHGWKFHAIIILSFVVCGIGFSHYDSVFSLVLSIGVFQMIRRIDIPEWFGRTVSFVSPSMFAVYLLHQTVHGYNFVEQGMLFARRVFDFAFLETFLASIFVWTACVGVDLVRRSLIQWCILFVSDKSRSKGC